MKYNKEQAIQRAYDNCNLIGIDADAYKEINKYSILRNLSQIEKDNIYDIIVKGLGF